MLQLSWLSGMWVPHVVATPTDTGERFEVWSDDPAGWSQQSQFLRSSPLAVGLISIKAIDPSAGIVQLYNLPTARWE